MGGSWTVGSTPGGAKGDRQVGRVALGAGCPTGLLLLPLFSLQGDPLGSLPSPSTSWGFLCFSVPSPRNAQALYTSLLVGHGVGC